MTLRDEFQERSDLVGSWVALSEPAIAEATAELGFDFVTVDTEHSPNTTETVEDMARAVDAASGDTDLIVRVPWNDQVAIKRVLDVGPSGIVVPMIDNAEQAREVVEAVRYPPEGNRGMGPLRAARYGLDMEEYVSEANESILTIVQIETEEGLENAEEIAAVDGIDGLFIGPADLSVNLGILHDGHHFGDETSETFENAVDRIREAAHAEGKVLGTVTGTVEDVEKWADRGVDFLNVGLGVGYIIEGALAHKAAFEDAVDEREE